MHKAPRIDDDAVGAIARTLGCDPRSVVRRLAGLPVRGAVGRSIDAAISSWRASEENPPDGRAA